MKISTRGRYAFRMMIDLAQHYNEGFISLKDISARQKISKKYLEQIVPLLSGAGILKTNRGYKGGYRLASEPSKYTVGMILRLTEGSLAPVHCAEQECSDCERSTSCPTRYVWQGLYKAVNEYLESITLQDILDKVKEI